MKGNSNIFDEGSGCIRQDIFLQYLKGQLSGKERNLVERHLLECEMCSDELEGLSNLSEPERIIEIEAELNTKVDRRAAPRIILFNPKVVYRVAAVAVLTLGISSVLYLFVVRNTPSALLTESSSKELTAEVADSIDSEVLNVKSIPKDANEFGQPKKEERKRIENPIILADKMRVADDITLDADSVSEVLAYSEAEVANEEIVAKYVDKNDSQALANYNAAMAGRKSEDAKTATLEIQKEAVAAAPAERSKSSKKSMATAVGSTQQQISIESALKNYNQKNYQSALQEFNMLYSQNTQNDTLIYYRAMCFYQLESFNEAIVGLETIYNNSASKFYYDAQWYYALSLVELGRNDEARDLFEAISKSDSPFKNSATKKIDD